MGSFNGVCIVSNLPIEGGTPIRFLALTKNRYHRDHEYICYVSGRWQLRCPPLRGAYNDYGTIDDIKPGLVERVFFTSFDRDIIEKGVGDNTCHDVHVRAGMSQKEWLNALWEGRVEVEDTYAWPALSGEALAAWKAREPKEPLIPTIRRVEKALQDGGLSVSTSDEKSGFVIDEPCYGYIRVRDSSCEDYKKHTESLGRALKAITKAGFSGMITAGDGSYQHNVELIVAPPPGTKFHGHIGPNDPLKSYSNPRPVSQAMIREDVWQLLLRPTKSWHHGKVTIERLKEDAKTYFVKKKELEKAEDEAKSGEWGKVMKMRDELEASLFGSFLRHPEPVSGFSLKKSLDLALELAKTDEERDEFINDLCETFLVESNYSILHGQWHPTTNGSQDRNWDEVRAFHLQLSKIKGNWEDEEGEA